MNQNTQETKGISANGAGSERRAWVTPALEKVALKDALGGPNFTASADVPHGSS